MMMVERSKLHKGQCSAIGLGVLDQKVTLAFADPDQ